jgi:hypothetical protein
LGVLPPPPPSPRKIYHYHIFAAAVGLSLSISLLSETSFVKTALFFLLKKRPIGLAMRCSMDQLSIKIPNPECRLFLKIYQ